jgi:FkbM family methyltransferase
MLATKTKVRLAAVAYRFVTIGRRMAGKDNQVTVRRGGLNWRLDLTEGIDFSIYLLGAFERSTVATLQRLVKPGDVVFDIGANIGAHTLGLARSAGPTGQVYAFEPSAFAFEKLKCNLALNPALEAHTLPLQVFLVAQSAERIRGEIYASWPLDGDASVHPKHRGRLVTTDGAVTDTLDQFVGRQGIDRLNLIKLDVDGHELPVLRGGLKVLKRFRPILVMEMSPYVHAENKQSFAELVSLLRETGYALQNADDSRALPLDANKLEALVPDGASINVIAKCDRAT